MREPSGQIVVIGAGAAGLGVAIELQRCRLPALILERSEEVGGAWRDRYLGLRLNTVRALSGVRRDPIPSAYGRWLDRQDFLTYLEGLPHRHRLEVETGIEVARVDREERGWVLETSRGRREAWAVIVATGYDRVPKLPAWPGADGFRGELLHSAAYREPAPYRGRDVLVVGAGNSASEIATELACGGAGRVRLAVRTPANLVPAELAGVPSTWVARAAEEAPAWAVDRIARAIQRAAFGDLSGHGLPPAPHGIATELELRGLGPVLERGLVAALERGAIEIVAAVERLDGAGVVLADGSRVEVDAVIAATGFRHGLEGIVGHLDVLDERGRPRIVDGRDDERARNLLFHGFWLPLSGQLPAMRRSGRRIARTLARRFGTPARLGRWDA